MAKMFVQNTTCMELTLKLLLQDKHEEALLNNKGRRYTSAQATVAFIEIKNYILKIPNKWNEGLWELVYLRKVTVVQN